MFFSWQQRCQALRVTITIPPRRKGDILLKKEKDAEIL